MLPHMIFVVRCKNHYTLHTKVIHTQNTFRTIQCMQLPTPTVTIHLSNHFDYAPIREVGLTKLQIIYLDECYGRVYQKEYNTKD